MVKPPEGLEQKLERVQQASTMADTLDIFHSISPVQALLSKRSFQLFLLAQTIFYIILYFRSPSTWTSALPSLTNQHASRLRFTALSLRSGAAPEHPNIGALGLLLNGCKVPMIPVSESVDGASLLVELEQPAEFNGWWFSTAEEVAPSEDPVQFVLEGARGGESSWARVGSSTARLAADWKMRYGAGRYGTTQQRGEEERFDYRVTWPSVLGLVVIRLGVMFSHLVVVVLAMSGRSLLAKHIFLRVFLVSAALSLVVAVGFVVLRQHRSSLIWFIFALVSIALPLAVERWKQSFIPVVFSCGVLLFVGELVAAVAVFSNPEELWTTPPLFAALLVGFSLVYTAVVRFRKRQAALLISADKHALDAWMHAFLDAQGVPAKQLLFSTLRALDRTVKARGEVPRQLNVRQSATGVRDGRHGQRLRQALLACETAALGGPDASSPARSMDQLRTQAAVMSHLLRESVFFAGLEEMEACVRLVGSDNQVRVVRVKDALLDEHQAQWTAGYRFVKLNLRLDTAFTRRFGLHTHVMELLLRIQPLHEAALQTEETYRRYINFRNVRPVDATMGRDVRLHWRLTDALGGAWRRDRNAAEPLPASSQAAPRLSLASSTVAEPTSAGLVAGANRLGGEEALAEGSGEGATPASGQSQLSQHSTEQWCARGAEEWKLLETVLGRTARLPADFLQSKVSYVTDAIARASTDSLLFTSRPMAAATSRLQWQLLLLFFSLYCFWGGFASLAVFRDLRVGRSTTALRFTALESRDGRTAGLAPHVDDLRLLFDLCDVDTSHLTPELRRAGPSLFLNLSRPVAFNGWAFRTADHDPSQDPVRFQVDQWVDTDARWELISASAHVQITTGLRPHPRGRFATPQARGMRVEVDLRAPLGAQLVYGVNPFSAAVFLLALVVAARAGEVELTSWIFSGTFFCAWLYNLGGGVAFLAQGHHVSGLYWILFSPASLFISVVVGFCESWLVSAVTVKGAYIIALEVIWTWAVFGDMSLFLSSLPITGIFFFGTGVLAQLLRWRAKAQSTRVISEDMRRYNQQWDALLELPDTLEHLQALRSAAASLARPERAQARQFELAQSPWPTLHALPDDSSLPSAAASTGAVDASTRPAPATADLSQPPDTAAGASAFPAALVYARAPTGSRSQLPEQQEVSGPAHRGKSPDAAEESGTGEQARSRGHEGAEGSTAAATLVSLHTADGVPRIGAEAVARGGSAGAELDWTRSGTGSLSVSGDSQSSSLRGWHMAGSRLRDWSSWTVQRAKGVGVGTALGPRRVRRALSFRSGKAVERIDRSAPVMSLDQLYFQAAGMDTILRCKAQQWAMKSDGCFFRQPTLEQAAQGQPEGELVRWADLAGEEDGHLRVRWARVKAPDRAVEKLLRSYKQDASRLLDICRQSIVFHTLPALLRCLSAVGQDPEVVVVRVKNKLDPDYRASRTAGYRDVALNLRIESEQTRRLGLDGFVCEVMLLLASFAQHKHDEGHARYISYRNERAE